jgi:threonine/homoserine/homoserine lactone efflux protein
LAWKIARSAPNDQSVNQAKPQTFVQAALFQWINPKALVMGTSAIATFTTVGVDIFMQISIIVAVFFLITWPAVGTWLLFGASLQKILRNQRQQKIFNAVMALLLIASMHGVVIELAERYYSLVFN